MDVLLALGGTGVLFLALFFVAGVYFWREFREWVLLAGAVVFTFTVFVVIQNPVSKPYHRLSGSVPVVEVEKELKEPTNRLREPDLDNGRLEEKLDAMKQVEEILK